MQTKIFISVPCYDATMTMQCTISIMNLTQLLTSNKINFVIDFIGNESLITRARNNSLGKFMSTDFTHILFIDSDIEFNPSAVLDLLLFDKDVVCCAYPKKGYNWKKLIYSMQNEKSNESLESRGLDFSYNALTNENNELITNGDFIKVHHASTGFMLIKRQIIEKLTEKHSDLNIITARLSETDKEICGLFCCIIKNKRFLSEDFSFCERVNDIGGEVWINVKHNLNHIGKYVFKSDIKNRKYHGRKQFERMFYSNDNNLKNIKL